MQLFQTKNKFPRFDIVDRSGTTVEQNGDLN